MIPEQLSWAYTGQLRSRDHLAVIEPYQNKALCGVAITGMGQYRPRTMTGLCPKCAREARKLRVDPAEVGLENDLY